MAIDLGMLFSIGGGAFVAWLVMTLLVWVFNYFGWLD